MQKLGMQRAFTDAAQFPKFQSGMGNVSISRILHEAILEVNEEGAEAAAATAVEMHAESAREEPPRLIINRPFFVAIVDDATGAILFAGAIHRPEALESK
jgi:serpin B